MLSQNSGYTVIQYGRKLSYVTLIWLIIKCKLKTKVTLRLKESDLLKKKNQTQTTAI